MTRIPLDQDVRITALDPTRSFIIQAPAGSGKTELLTQRLLVLLAQAECPEEIIAITFTRKAAAEMRQRVLDALKRDPEKHAQLLLNPHRLKIQTIDSFCADLTRRMPLSSGFGGTPQILEDPFILYREAASRLLSRLEEDGPYSQSIATLLLHLDNRVSLLEDLLIDMLRKRDQWLPHIIPGASRDMLEEGLQHVIHDTLTQCHLATPKPLYAEIESLLGGDWLIIANRLLTEKGEWRKTVTKREGFPAEDKAAKARMLSLLKALSNHETLRLLLVALKACPPPHYTDAQWHIIEALLHLLPLLTAELNVVFGEQNASDFTEITLAAIRALGELDAPSELALILDYQIRHLLIDEFQDTSTTHARLLTHLTQGWEHGDGRTLFIVGDPMQSIYRFREANVSLFLKAQTDGIGNLALIPLRLTTNFRSTPTLIDWVNQHFTHIFPKVSDLASGAVSYNPSCAMDAPRQNTGVYVHACTNNQTQQIIDIIQQERGTSPHHTIALLVRSRTHLLDILPALKNANLPFSAVEIEALRHQPITRDLLALTRALMHLSDRASWLAILRAPWCGLTLQDLHTLAAQNHHTPLWETLIQFQIVPHLSIDANIRLQKIIPILAHSLQQRQRLSLKTWISHTWKALHGPECLNNEHEYAMANTFFAVLDTLDTAGDLPDIAQLEKKIAEKFATPEHTEHTTLHVMTIHKAKGLEFDTVIIPHLERKSPGESEQLLRWQENPFLLASIKARETTEDPIYQYLHRTETLKIQHETTRLLYVAATRAKKNLHLLADVSELSSKKPHKNSFLALLASLFTPITSSPSLDLPIAPAPIQHFLTRLPTDFIASTILSPPFDSPTANLPPFIATQFHGGLRKSLAAASASAVGTVTHKILQHIAQTDCTQWSQDRVTAERPRWESWLIQAGLEHIHLANSLTQITHMISQTLNDPRGQWILQKREEENCELALTTVIDDQIVHLVIDRTFIDEHGRRWIIDYKTSADIDLDQAQALHAPQLHRYAQALTQIDTRPIHLGLYFPAFGGWREWAYTI